MRKIFNLLFDKWSSKTLAILRWVLVIDIFFIAFIFFVGASSIGYLTSASIAILIAAFLIAMFREVDKRE